MTKLSLQPRNVALRDLGKYEEAVEHAEQLTSWALAWSTESGLEEEGTARRQRVLASSLRKWARCEAFVGDAPAAWDALNRAEEFDLISEVAANKGKNWFAKGEIYRHTNNPKEAVEVYVEAINIAELSADLDLYAWSCLCASDAHFMIGNMEVAGDFIKLSENAIKLFDESLPVEQSHILLSRLSLEIIEGRVQAGGADVDQLIKIYDDRGVLWVRPYLESVAKNKRSPYAKRF